MHDLNVADYVDIKPKDSLEWRGGIIKDKHLDSGQVKVCSCICMKIQKNFKIKILVCFRKGCIQRKKFAHKIVHILFFFRE